MFTDKNIRYSLGNLLRYAWRAELDAALRIRCDHYRHEYLLPFPCKSRPSACGPAQADRFCLFCHQKNVQTIAAFLTARVLVPVLNDLTFRHRLRPSLTASQRQLRRVCELVAPAPENKLDPMNAHQEQVTVLREVAGRIWLLGAGHNDANGEGESTIMGDPFRPLHKP